MSESKKAQRQRALIFRACCGLVATSVGLCTNPYGVFYTPLSEALGVGRAAVTFHATISGLLTGLLGPLMVRLTDRFPVKRIVCFGATMCALSFFPMIQAKSVWMLNLCGVLRGIGDSCFFMPIITLILGNWFKKNLGSVMGIVMAFSGIVGAAMSPILAKVIALYGYKTALALCGTFVVLTTYPLSGTILKLKPEKSAPEEERSERDSCVSGSARLVNRFSYSSPVFYCLVGMTFLSVFVIGLTSHISGIGENLGVGAEIGATMISAAMIGNIFSKFAAGFSSDKIGPVKTFALIFLIATSGCALMLVTRTTSFLLVASFLYGTIYAVTAIGLPSVVRLVYGDRQYGRAFSIISMVSVVAPSVSMFVVGYLYDLAGNYALAIKICGGSALGALALWLLAVKLAKRYNDFPDAENA